MADYRATAHTNQFKVKDVPALIADLAEHGISTRIIDTPDQPRFGSLTLKVHPTQGTVCLASETDHGTWPTVAEPYDDDDAPPGNTPWDQLCGSLPDVVARHLQGNSVAVFFEVGSLKHVSLGGYALAINAEGESRNIDLEDIYQIARDALGETLTT